MTAAALVCGSCGVELPPNSKFCNECGAPVATATKPAEYKQVTVLFADVVHSMDIAAAVGAERLREIMTDLADRCAAVVQRYGGTVDKFTGDGIMAVFGAPVALEDHAVRACLAALGVQEETKRLAVDIQERDGVDLRMRVGLNSGQVIAGEIGSGAFGYTAIGEQVGMAQRMESVAPPGGVLLSESTARLVERAAVLGDPQLMRIKGTVDPVCARQLVAVSAPRERIGGRVSTLVGREWELAALTAMLDRSIEGHGCVAGVVGPPGIGKSRIVAETASVAASRGVQVFSTFCESHTSEVPFHTVTGLLRAALGIGEVDAASARVRVRSQLPGADAADLVLLDDLLGIRDLAVDLSRIAADARRRRLTALISAAMLARSTPRVYVIEDVHWVDQSSEAMLADFLSVILQTPSLVLITFRPEYRGSLGKTPSAETLALAPLDDAQTGALIGELLGSHASVAALAHKIAERAAGNPFFVEEIVRDLADRGVLTGERNAFVCTREVAEVSVPATLQAAIAARIDRLDSVAKQLLSAAAVIGLRFGVDLLERLADSSAITKLVDAGLIDRVGLAPRTAYAFRHPLIREVAYRSQLKSDRAVLHGRLAAAVEEHDPASVEKNAALIAEHLEAAGDLREAFGWHMRAGTWANYRDIRAARTSWQRARSVADRLPAVPGQSSMRIAPRAMLCSTAWRVGGDLADSGFDELRELCIEASDKPSLAIATAGQLLVLAVHARYRESSRLAAEFAQLLESIDDPTIIMRALPQVMVAKYEAGHVAEALRLSQRVIDLADGDSAKGNRVYLAALARASMMRGLARCSLGRPGWKSDLDEAISTAGVLDPTSRVLVTTYAYGITVANGALVPDAAIMRHTAEALEIAERSSDDFGVATTRWVLGLVLADRHGADRELGFDLRAKARQTAVQQQYSMPSAPMIDIEIAREKLRLGDVDGAVEDSRKVFNELLDTGGMLWHGPAINILVESLLARGGDADLQAVQEAIDRLEAVPTEPGIVFYELPLLRLRALLARAHGDAAAYGNFRDRYRDMARTLGYEGHIAWAEALP
jgi:adenylate cyclase